MNEPEFRPKINNALFATCQNCGGLFQFLKKPDNQECHICKVEDLAFHDSLRDATKSLTYEQEQK